MNFSCASRESWEPSARLNRLASGSRTRLKRQSGNSMRFSESMLPRAYGSRRSHSSR